MASLNRVDLIGYLGSDPEVKYLASGTALANFSVATTEQWKDKESGEKKSETTWHRCTAFGKLAEIVGEYLKKGSMVFVSGRIKNGKYEKDGQTHYTTDVVVNEMRMLDRKPEGERQPRPSGGGQQQSRPAPTSNFDEDDIPFN